MVVPPQPQRQHGRSRSSAESHAADANPACQIFPADNPPSPRVKANGFANIGHFRRSFQDDDRIRDQVGTIQPAAFVLLVDRTPRSVITMPAPESRQSLARFLRRNRHGRRTVLDHCPCERRAVHRAHRRRPWHAARSLRCVDRLCQRTDHLRGIEHRPDAWAADLRRATECCGSATRAVGVDQVGLAERRQRPIDREPIGNAVAEQGSSGGTMRWRPWQRRTGRNKRASFER
jgi:hypothetical protein